MKNICRNCHFLAKEYREQGTAYTATHSFNEADRRALESDPEHVVTAPSSIKCYLGVWDEGVAEPGESRDVVLNKTPRKNTCFFFPYHPAMLFEAAKELQARQQQNRQLKESNMYTRIGLYVAAGALVANVLVTYFKG